MCVCVCVCVCVFVCSSNLVDHFLVGETLCPELSVSARVPNRAVRVTSLPHSHMDVETDELVSLLLPSEVLGLLPRTNRLVNWYGVRTVHVVQ